MNASLPPEGQESPFKGKTGIRRLINAASYSIDGFRAAYRHEDAFRQEIHLALALVPLAVLAGRYRHRAP